MCISIRLTNNCSYTFVGFTKYLSSCDSKKKTKKKTSLSIHASLVQLDFHHGIRDGYIPNKQ